jgi:hypothetical protein
VPQPTSPQHTQIKIQMGVKIHELNEGISPLEVDNLKAIQEVPFLYGTGGLISIFTIQIGRENDFHPKRTVFIWPLSLTKMLGL